MPRVGFVTCARWPALSESDALAARALQARGVVVEAVPWNAPGPQPDSFDALVLRANWDYHFTPDAFLAWLAGVERTGRPVWNSPGLVRWNFSSATSASCRRPVYPRWRRSCSIGPRRWPPCSPSAAGPRPW